MVGDAGSSGGSTQQALETNDPPPTDRHPWLGYRALCFGLGLADSAAQHSSESSGTDAEQKTGVDGHEAGGKNGAMQVDRVAVGGTMTRNAQTAARSRWRAFRKEQLHLVPQDVCCWLGWSDCGHHC